MVGDADNSTVTVSEKWEEIGAITICSKGRPRFPRVTAAPGLYRIKLADGRVYIGEAKDIRRRLSEYRNPTSGTEGEHLLHQEIVRAAGGKVAIYRTPDGTDRRTRRGLEKQEIKAAIQRNEPILNSGGKAYSSLLEAKLRYYEEQIQKVRAQLAKLG